MKKTFYVQTDKQGRITDITELPYEGYVETELHTPLQTQITAGAYQLVNGSAVYRPNWDVSAQRIAKLESTIAELSMMMGAMA